MSSVAHIPDDPLPLGRRRIQRTPGGLVVAWLRANLFPSIPSTIVTLLLVFVLGKACISVWQWAWTPIQVVDRDPAEPDRFRILHAS